MKHCKYCGEPIPEQRLKILPNTETCVKCSDVNKKKAFKVITSKTTYSELDTIDDNTYKVLKNFERKWHLIRKK
jgi:hypothetical protein